MQELRRILAVGRILALAFAMATLAGGCGSDGKTTTYESVAKSQQASRSAWEKAKAEGKDKPSVPAKVISSQGYAPHVNKPGI